MVPEQGHREINIETMSVSETLLTYLKSGPLERWIRVDEHPLWVRSGETAALILICSANNIATISSDLIDVTADIDATLTLPENIANIMETYHLPGGVRIDPEAFTAMRREYEERMEPVAAVVEPTVYREERNGRGLRIRLLGRALEEKGIPIHLLNLGAATDLSLSLGENVMKVMRAFKLIKRTRKRTAV